LPTDDATNTALRNQNTNGNPQRERLDALRNTTIQSALDKAIDKMQSSADKLTRDLGDLNVADDLIRAQELNDRIRAEQELLRNVLIAAGGATLLGTYTNGNPTSFFQPQINPANPTATPSNTSTPGNATSSGNPITGAGASINPNPLNNVNPTSPNNLPRDNVVQFPNRNTNPISSNPETNTCKNTDSPFSRCFQDIEQKLDRNNNNNSQNNSRLEGLINALAALLNGVNFGLLQTIDAKLGSALPNGLSGFLVDKFTKLWRSRVVDRALALANFAVGLHNALMLSRDLGQTLISIIANSLSVIGIKDADDTAYSFSQAIGNGIENIVRGIIGTENYTQLTTQWAKANRIYQSAVNIYQLTTDSTFAITEGLNTIGEHTGKIGNALKRSSVVLENSYNWFGERFNFRTGKNRAIQRVIDGLETAQSVASDLEDITSNFREAAENINEIRTQTNALREEIQGKSDEKNTTETAGKNNSQGTNITRSDLVKSD
jgi:hypothetical protein